MRLLIEATVRISLILATGFAIATLLRTRAAALRHWVLAATIVWAAMAPALAAIAPRWHVGFGTERPVPSATSTVRSEVPSASAIAITTGVALPVDTVSVARPNPAAFFIVVWRVGAILSMLALFIGLGRLMWIGLRARRLDDPTWNEMLREAKREYGLSRSISLLETERPSLVVTWGAIAPKILVPRTALAWPADRVRVVLRHELAHVCRGDWLIQLIAEIVRAVYWFNPLLWIACRRMREESEHACDDAVIGLGVEGSEYASHLLDLARSMHGRRSVWVPAQAIVRPSTLERRISAMLNTRLNRKPLSTTGRLTSTLTMLAIAIVVAGFATSAQTYTILTGTISDQLAGVLPDVPILLTNLESGAKHEVRSDRVGHYEFVGLPAGEYMLRIDGVPGFAALQRRLDLSGASAERNLTLRIAAIQETITVTDAPPSRTQAPLRAPAQPRMREATEPCTSGCVGGNIGAPIKLDDVKPVFPASQTGVSGVVNLKGIIDTTGHVTSLQVVGEANPDFANAAIAAVSQWEFDPTRLNGVLIETEINVSVAFSANR